MNYDDMMSWRVLGEVGDEGGRGGVVYVAGC